MLSYERGDYVKAGTITVPDTKRERCVILGEYIIDNEATVRSTAKVYGISKSTVHQDVTVRLAKVDPHQVYRPQCGGAGTRSAAKKQGRAAYKRRSCNKAEISERFKMIHNCPSV